MSPELAQYWVDGAWRGSEADRTLDSFNPANGERLGRAVDADAGIAAEAIASARRAFDRTPWAQSPRLRAQVMLQFARNVAARKEILADLLTLENGKPRAAAAGEIAGCVSELEYYAGLARTIAGRVMEVTPLVYSTLLREPAGVAAVIVPWNAPGILLVRSLAPALAAGCTAVVKAAPQTALFTAAFLRCLSDVAELPAGTVTLFTESGSDGARLLVQSPDVDVVSYTGSTSVGKRIMADAAPTLKRLCLELGGKAPAIVFPDVEIEKTAASLARAGTILSGQQCTALSRVLVHRSIAAPLRDALAAALDRLVVGPGMDAKTEMGPLIDAASCDRILGLQKTASEHGEVVLPVRRGEGALEAGSFLRPGLVSVTDMDAPGAATEVFGPMLNLEPFDEEDEAAHRANYHPYGLSASVWTRDRDRGDRVARRLRSGTVWINQHNLLIPEAETGGVRDSGFGRQHGVEGLDLFLQTKHLYREVAAS